MNATFAVVAVGIENWTLYLVEKSEEITAHQITYYRHLVSLNPGFDSASGWHRPISFYYRYFISTVGCSPRIAYSNISLFALNRPNHDLQFFSFIFLPHYYHRIPLSWNKEHQQNFLNLIYCHRTLMFTILFWKLTTKSMCSKQPQIFSIFFFFFSFANTFSSAVAALCLLL